MIFTGYARICAAEEAAASARLFLDQLGAVFGAENLSTLYLRRGEKLIEYAVSLKEGALPEDKASLFSAQYREYILPNEGWVTHHTASGLPGEMIGRLSGDNARDLLIETLSPDGGCEVRTFRRQRCLSVADAISLRRSYRGNVCSIDVPREDLITILEAGLAAPSGCNKQTTSFIAVDDPQVLESILSLIDPPIAKTARAAILVLTQRIFAYRDKCFAVQDYSAAIENMLLAIASMGYASCWYEGHITDDDRICDRIAEVLGVPEGYEVVCLLPIGVPERASKPLIKKPFEERAWFNGFGKEE